MDAPKSLAFASLPALAPLVAAAEAAFARGELDAALEGHKKALLLIPPADAAARASALASIGEIKRAQGKAREAESNFEKALDAVPGHRRALDALIAMAAEAKDLRRVILYRRKLVDALTDDGERLREIMRLVDVLEAEPEGRLGAVGVLEAARLLAPRDPAILARLRGLYERANAWAKVMSVVGAQCTSTQDPIARAALRFTQGDIALGRLRHDAEGLEAMELALADDPTHEKALAAVEAVRGRKREWAELARVYEKLVDLHAKRGDATRAFTTCMKLAGVRRDRLRDGPGAIEALEGAITCAPSDVDARAQLAELLHVKGDTDAAIAELEKMAVIAPTRTKTYERLASMHTRENRLDLAWLAALSLDELGAADVDQQILLDQFRPEGAIRPADVLDDRAWDAHLRATDHGGGDDVVAAIMRAVGAAAVAARVDELRAARKLMPLDPQKLQAKTSTVSIVRTFAWASRILGIAQPDLYVMDDVPGGLAAVQVPAPTIAIGPAVLRGLAVQELAFVAARHLTYFRPEHYPLVFYPTIDDLTSVFLAAVTIPPGREAVSSRLGESVARRRAALEKHLGAPERDALGEAVARLDARGGTADLTTWVRGVEFSAGRAGLVLAGDLAMALKRIKGETRAVGGLSAEERRGDLLAFCASRRHAALRERLKIGAGSPPSLMPPPGSMPPPALSSSTLA